METMTVMDIGTHTKVYQIYKVIVALHVLIFYFIYLFFYIIMIILYLSPMALTLAFLYTSLLSWTVTGSFPHSVSREGIKEEKRISFDIMK